MTVTVWGPVQEDMRDLLADQPDDVPAVVDQLTALQALLDRVPPLLGSNPLADFNKRYVRITASLLERLYAGTFADPAFLSRLDVEFAGRYFDAIRAWSDASACCPRVWSVLFDRIAGPDCRPPKSAAAGVNAHINFDLPFALVTTFDHLGSDPIDDSEQHRDYLQIHDIFAEAIPELRPGYPHARNVAWRNAQKLWAMRHDLPGTAEERARLDTHAAALSRLLLSPPGQFLQ